MSLGNLDLNLMLALDALLREANVTRAAERLNLTQPTLSASLARLRKHFDDELLRRHGNELRPTPLAIRLRPLVEETLNITDGHGTTVAAALDEIGFRGADEIGEVAAYSEIHVEQGPILDTEGIAIGLVESTWAARKYEIKVHGEQSHTGSTVMRQRRDALLGAARIVVLIRELADDVPDDRMHTSVGHLTVVPNSPVVVAKEAHLYADMRSADPALLDRADQRLRAECARIERETGVEIELALSHKWDTESYTPAGVDLAESLADKLELPHRRLATIAGHDSTNMKDQVPTVMLFVPSVDAIAHNELEFTEDRHLLMGLDLLTEVAYALVHGELNT